ncbi:hypothetical protein Gorai_000312 [Gossypium raimondii]|uniref:RNase H type-1 domain-containing protein n=1 Tax=Gossypium raimondii TaxID=29730 RepID=A0A7J8PD93_GOSRA|nr:hypothetical protein [Gossypium raimondii]
MFDRYPMHKRIEIAMVVWALCSCFECRSDVLDKSIRWNPPPILLVKINIDAIFSLQQRKACLRVVIKDASGMIMGACSRVTLPVSSVIFVEALAVLHMLRFAVDLEFQFVVLERDARKIVQMLQAESDDFFAISALIWEAKGLSQLFLECRFAFLERSRNRTEYAVAEEGMSRLEDRF